MELIQKPWKHGTRLAYDNVNDNYLNFEKNIRVLPSPYFYEPTRRFLLIEKFEPGSAKPYNEGAFHVWDDDNNEHRFFYLDQVIVHPDIIAKRKQKVETIGIIVDAINIPKGKGKRGRRPLNPELKKQKELNKENHIPGRRGRKPLDPEVKAKRDAEKAEKKAKGTGKRGRPAMDPSLRKTKPYVPKGTTGKRGRPTLPPELRKTKPYVKTGGKRGRPKKNQ